MPHSRPGLSLTIWMCAPSYVVECLSSLCTLCLEKEEIPRAWKKVILIPKGKIDINLPKARPICLLNDVGKFFERILDRRLKAHLNTLPRLRAPFQTFVSGMQFGFCEGFSTIDALNMVTNYIRDKTDDGKIVLAASILRIHSLSWNSIRRYNTGNIRNIYVELSTDTFVTVLWSIQCSPEYLNRGGCRAFHMSRCWGHSCGTSRTITFCVSPERVKDLVVL